MGILNLTPERRIQMAALGQGLMNYDAGRPMNMVWAQKALADRRLQDQQRKMLDESGVMGRFSPEQRSILAQMEPGAAIQVIAQNAFAQGPRPTDDMREYQMAVSQGFGGTLGDWIRGNRKAGATTVNVGPQGVNYGTPPSDMAWLRNEDGTVRLDERGLPMAGYVQGSPSDRKAVRDVATMAGEAIDAVDIEVAGAESTAQSGSVVLEDINRIQDLIEDAPWYAPTAGFFGNIFKEIAGTPAADVKALATTIRANIGFDRLQQMREASPTGGALGQVTVQELERLEAVMGSLVQSQSEDQLIENLERLEGIYTKIMRKASAYPNAADFGFGEVNPDPLGLR